MRPRAKRTSTGRAVSPATPLSQTQTRSKPIWQRFGRWRSKAQAPTPSSPTPASYNASAGTKWAAPAQLPSDIDTPPPSQLSPHDKWATPAPFPSDLSTPPPSQLSTSDKWTTPAPTLSDLDAPSPSPPPRQNNRGIPIWRRYGRWRHAEHTPSPPSKRTTPLPPLLTLGPANPITPPLLPSPTLTVHPVCQGIMRILCLFGR